MVEGKQKIIELIQKLQAVQVERGASPAEAERAAMHVQRLLAQHQLSLLDVEAKTFDDDMGDEIVDLPGQVRQSWFFDLSFSVSKPFDCQSMIRREWNKEAAKIKLTLRFLGYDSDVKVARYLFTFLSRVLMQMADDAGRRAGRYGANLISFRKAFMQGAAGRILQRLMAEKRSREKASDSRALVLIKAPKVAEWVKEQSPMLETVEVPGSDDHEALEAGDKAAKEIELTPAVENDEDETLAISAK